MHPDAGPWWRATPRLGKWVASYEDNHFHTHKTQLFLTIHLITVIAAADTHTAFEHRPHQTLRTWPGSQELWASAGPFQMSASSSTRTTRALT